MYTMKFQRNYNETGHKLMSQGQINNNLHYMDVLMKIIIVCYNYTKFNKNDFIILNFMQLKFMSLQIIQLLFRNFRCCFSAQPVLLNSFTDIRFCCMILQDIQKIRHKTCCKFQNLRSSSDAKYKTKCIEPDMMSLELLIKFFIRKKNVSYILTQMNFVNLR